MEILNEITTDLVNPSINLSDILRKAKVLAYRLNSEEMKNWVDLELDGYYQTPLEEIPDYRKIHTQTFGHFISDFREEIKNAPIGPASLPEVPQDYITVFPARLGIRSLETTILENEHSHKFLWPQNNVMAIGEKVYPSYHCIQAWWLVNNSNIEQIIDTVRNRLLSFVLELERRGIELDDVKLENKEKSFEIIPQVFNTYILGGQTIFGNVEKLTHNTQYIMVGDFSSLSHYLSKIGVQEKDISELQSAINEDQNSRDKKSIGSKVEKWVKVMTKKATSGLWKTSFDVAANVLTQALFRYYGLN